MQTLKYWWNRLKYYSEPEVFTKQQVIEILEKSLMEMGFRQSGGEMILMEHRKP